MQGFHRGDQRASGNQLIEIAFDALGRHRARKLLPWLSALAVLAGLTLQVGSVAAQIKNPGAHPRYDFEAEPHLVVSNHGHGGDALGVGFRGSWVLAHKAFVPSINNSVGIGFGADALFLGDDHCHGNTCHDHGLRLVLPVVMQWNFWLHKKWSVFGEPGLAIFLHDDDNDPDDDFDIDVDPLVLMIGGRFHMNDSTTLTLRLGFPTQLTFGVSFLM